MPYAEQAREIRPVKAARLADAFDFLRDLTKAPVRDALRAIGYDGSREDRLVVSGISLDEAASFAAETHVVHMECTRVLLIARDAMQPCGWAMQWLDNGHTPG
jgi:hypothetical protein